MQCSSDNCGTCCIDSGMGFTYCASKVDCVKVPSTTASVLAILVALIVFVTVLLLFYFFLRFRKLNSLLELKAENDIAVGKQTEMPESNRTSAATSIRPPVRSTERCVIVQPQSTIIQGLQTRYMVSTRPPPVQVVRQPQRYNQVIMPNPPKM